jgi:ParB/RepB/Spo0J family partition protein
MMHATPEASKRKTKESRSLDTIKEILTEQTNQTIDQLNRYQSLVGKIVKIPLRDIHLDENIRSEIDTEGTSFKSLLDSIKKHGIQQNIVVEFRRVENDFKIICVSGHRRVTAAKIAGTVDAIPALIKQFDQIDTRTELALAENLLREDLHCLDTAEGYKKLASNGWSKDKLANTFGKTLRTIATYLKMADWPSEAKKIVRQHPEKFTTRLLTRKIACRRFTTNESLVQALQLNLSKDSLSKNSKASKKEKIEADLNAYLVTKKYKEEINSAITLAFQELSLIK